MKNTRLLLLAVLMWVSCNNTPPKITYKTAPNKTKHKEKLIQANRGLVVQDADSIRDFLKTKTWDMKEHDTGLWYEITQEGKGPLAKSEMQISLRYTLSLLDSTVLYSSKVDGIKKFKVGHGGVETGLENIVLLLRKNSRARVILPPYLAHGLTGDNNKIPPRAILLYQLEVTELQPASVK